MWYQREKAGQSVRFPRDTDTTSLSAVSFSTVLCVFLGGGQPTPFRTQTLVTMPKPVKKKHQNICNLSCPFAQPAFCFQKAPRKTPTDRIKSACTSPFNMESGGTLGGFGGGFQLTFHALPLSLHGRFEHRVSSVSKPPLYLISLPCHG